jgi:hypothetical protein
VRGDKDVGAAHVGGVGRLEQGSGRSEQGSAAVVLGPVVDFSLFWTFLITI